MRWGAGRALTARGAGQDDSPINHDLLWRAPPSPPPPVLTGHVLSFLPY
jgi:hypothetical protein